jgi:hypothetical protein
MPRLAEIGGAWSRDRDVVLLTVEFERLLALQDFADDGDVFVGPGQGTTVGHAVPAFDHLWARGTESQHEAAA